MTNPKITVVTVCYNAVRDIEKTILSVVNQTYEKIEYIIIDGASTDGTVDVIKKYEDRITKWISEPDKGIYDAMNKGIRMASGEWINFMNAGDAFCDIHVIKDTRSCLDDSYDIVYGDVVKKKGDQLIPFKAERLSLLNYRMPFSHQSCFTKLSVMKHYMYDTTYKIVADYNFFHSLYVKKGTFYHVNLYVSIYEAVDGLSSKNYWKSIKENAKVIKGERCKAWFFYFLLNYLRGYSVLLKEILIG